MVFKSTSWTGRNNISDEVTTMEPPKFRMESAPKKLAPRIDTAVMREDVIAEYREVAKQVGISDQDMIVEEFRLFLSKHDIPSFNLQEVVSYMDDIAAKDNPTGFGWHWCPVRAKDAEVAMTFGKPSRYGDLYRQAVDTKTHGSDFYESHKFNNWHHDGGSGWLIHHSDGEFIRTQGVTPTPRDWRLEPSPVYTRTLPLHALKKIALIEKHFTAGKAVFLVSDYTIAPHVIINPDPFLMAVIPNSAVAHGKGRFIIDIWDEPGFGLERMLKPA